MTGIKRDGWRRIASWMAVLSMMAHLGLAAFHHHDSWPTQTAYGQTAYGQTAYTAKAVSTDDSQPLDDGSDCAVCQILSQFTTTLTPIVGVGLAVLVLVQILAACGKDLLARPPLVVGNPRAPPTRI